MDVLLVCRQVYGVVQVIVVIITCLMNIGRLEPLLIQ